LEFAYQPFKNDYIREMKMEKKNLFTKAPVVAALAIFCCALWGSASPAIKIGSSLCLPHGGVPSTMLFAGIRFAFAGFLTILIYSIARRRVLVPKLNNLGRVATVSVFQTVLQYIFFYVGLSNTSSVKGAVLSGSNAFFALLISALVFRMEKLTVKKVVACVLGFIGIIVVNLYDLDLKMKFMGEGFVLLSAIAYSISSVLIKKFSKHEDPVVISGYQFMMGGVFMMLVGWAFGGSVQFGSLKAVIILIYLSALSAVAYSLWGILLKYNPVSKVSIYSFMIPVFGGLLSLLILPEETDVYPLNLAITLVLICTGIFLINFNGKKQQ
jgi:drug/metabolite transporter (DMT)-like permease